MSTEFKSDHAVANPPPPTRHPVLAPVVAVVAFASVVTTILWVYAVCEREGDPFTSGGPIVPGLLVLVGVPAALVVWAVLLVQDLRVRPRPSFLALVPIVVVAMLAGVAVAAYAGVEVYERDQAVISAACTPQDVTVLDGFARYGLEYSGARGTKDGFCTAWIMVRGEDPAIAMATLKEQLSSEGWTLAQTGWPTVTVTRDGHTVVIEHLQSSEGTTGIGLTVLE